MLQTFQYQNTPITFSKDGEVMVNATQMAKPFGKEVTHFISNQQTQAFIEVLDAKLGIPSLRIQRGGNNPGTWVHQKLALKFAGWLSPEFELWVYDRIEELLTTGKTELVLNPAEMKLQVFRMLEEEAESLKEQLQLANATIQAQAPDVEYAGKVLKSSNTYTATTIAKELGMGAQTLNTKLNKLGVQYFHDGHWILYQKYQNKGYTDTKTHTYYDKENKLQTSLQTVWTEPGRRFIHSLLNPQIAAA